MKACGSTDGRDHYRPLRCSAWRRYHVRRDIPGLSQGFLASMVRARSSIGGRPFGRELHQAVAAMRTVFCGLRIFLDCTWFRLVVIT
jgi:hypothetical protein